MEKGRMVELVEGWSCCWGGVTEGREDEGEGVEDGWDSEEPDESWESDVDSPEDEAEVGTVKLVGELDDGGEILVGSGLKGAESERKVA
jgi:hypothetical protein